MTRTMVLVHGAFVGSWAWAPFRSHFESLGWRCIAPDLRHHNGAGDLEELGHTSLNDYMDDLLELARGLDEPPVLVGHSMGALLCQKVAAEGVGVGLILLSPAAGWGILPSAKEEYLARLALMQAGPNFWKKPVPPRFDYAAEAALDRFSPERQQELFAGFVPESGRALAEMMFWFLDPHQASSVDAHRVGMPVLCAVGSLDRVTPPDTVKSIARRYAGRVDYAEFDGHSHFLMGEPGFEKILAHCERWLADRFGRAG